MNKLFKQGSLWAGVSVLSVLIAGGLWVSTRTPDLAKAEDGAKPAAPALTVRVASAQKRSLVKTLEISGSVTPWEQINVGSETGGLKVTRVLVDEGQRVRRGQVLAVLNTDILLTQRAQSKARLASAQALVKQQRTLLQQNKALLAQGDANNKSFQALYKEGAVSQLDALARSTTVNTGRAQVEQAEQVIAVAQSNVAEARADLAQVEAQIARTRILAPDNGWVLKKQVFIGNISDVGAPMFVLARQGRLELNAAIPETDLPQLRVGQTVVLRSDADPQLRTTGRVRLISPEVDAQSRQATVKVALSANDRLRPGMFVRGTLALGTGQSLTVPAQAVTMRDNRSLVFIVGPANKVRSRRVEVGERNPEQVEIRSGLQVGERVVTTGGGYLKDGDTVKITSLKS